MQQIFDARSRVSVANIKALLNDLRSRGYSNDAKDLWSHYDELLSIYRSQSVEDPSRLEVMGDDERRFFWIRAKNGSKSYEWLQVLTAHYKNRLDMRRC